MARDSQARSPGSRNLQDPCTRERHEALKRDPTAFRKATRLVGIQTDGFKVPVELRNCLRCGSTLALRNEPAAASVETPEPEAEPASGRGGGASDATKGTGSPRGQNHSPACARSDRARFRARG